MKKKGDIKRALSALPREAWMTDSEALLDSETRGNTEFPDSDQWSSADDCPSEQVEASWQQFEDRIEAHQHASGRYTRLPVKAKGTRYRPLQIAASFLIGFSAAWAALYLQLNTERQRSENALALVTEQERGLQQKDQYISQLESRSNTLQHELSEMQTEADGLRTRQTESTQVLINTAVIDLFPSGTRGVDEPEYPPTNAIHGSMITLVIHAGRSHEYEQYGLAIVDKDGRGIAQEWGLMRDTFGNFNISLPASELIGSSLVIRLLGMIDEQQTTIHEYEVSLSKDGGRYHGT